MDDTYYEFKRNDKSLGLLTKKFVELLRQSSSGYLDLRYVSIISQFYAFHRNCGPKGPVLGALLACWGLMGAELDTFSAVAFELGENGGKTESREPMF